jgi:acetyl-CoA/propionyl-CoA carboxylase carboxyl transferase subunit
MTDQNLVPGDARDPQDPRDPQRRIEQILDSGTFTALTARDESGMLAGFGMVSGVRTTIFATDATIQGGAMGEAGANVILAAYADAMKYKNPIVGIWHSGGARLREGVKSLHAFGLVFHAITQASGKIPQFSLVLGPAAGGGAYGPALTDVIVLAPEGRIFVTGPDVVRSVTGESVDMARLGGPEPHGRRSGVVHIIAESEEHSYQSIQKLIRLLGDQGDIHDQTDDLDLATFLPESNKRAYDVHPLINGLLDNDSDVQELHPKWAPNIVTSLGRLSGRTIGVIANNPLRLGGCLDSSSAEKAARFVRMCDSFGVPLVVLVDVPGYLPGVGQEWDGVVRRGAKLLHAFSEAVVPRVTLITRKAYGGAYIAMNSRALGATKVFAWPTAEVAVMGAVAAIRVLHRRILADLPDDQRAAMELELAAEHEKISGGVARAIEIGVVDEIIEPSQSRSALARAITLAPAGRGMHSNIPL